MTSTAASSGASVLSDKVSRALEVRTDTPAMRAALDALADLPAPTTSQVEGTRHVHGGAAAASAGGGGGGGGGGVVDARSVRVAIERDALRQALLFEEELRALVGTVEELRESVGAVARAAARVGRCVEAGVVVSAGGGAAPGDAGSDEGKGSGEDGGSDDDGDRLPPEYPGSPSDALEEERRLASVLSDAFRARDEAARRADAVAAFLDRFDLSDEDAQLLDEFAFDEFDPQRRQEREQQQKQGINLDHADARKAEGDSMAFLDALERVRRIRSELIKTFGESSSRHGYGLGGRKKSHHKSDERLGATSAVRMMENLAQREERAYGRLYHFLQSYLDLNPVSHVPTSSAALANRHRGSHLQQHHSRHRLAPAGHRSHFGDDDDGLDEALFAHPFIRRSLYVLRHVPAYRAHTLELVASARRSEVTRRFLLALTSGYGGGPPIEMRAHDPVAYVGDMLAFVFRSFSVEAELARGLVDYRPGEGDDGENENGDGAEKAEGDYGAAKGEEAEGGEPDAADEDDPLAPDRPMSSADVLSHAVSGVSRPLRSRIGQVVSSLARRPDQDRDEDAAGAGAAVPGAGGADDLDEEGAASLNRLASLYSICGLLLFYRSAFEKGVWKLVRGGDGHESGPSSRGPPRLARDASTAASTASEVNPLIETAQQCLAEAAQAYAASLRVYAATLDALASETEGRATTCDLARAAVVRICDVRASSPGFAADVGAGDRAPLPRGGGGGGEDTDGDDAALSAAAESLGLEFLVDAVLGAAVGTFSGLDDAVALKFAAAAAKRSGLGSECYARWDAAISERERAAADALIEAETRKVLYACGLGSVREALRRVEEGGVSIVEGQTLASHPGLSKREVEAATKEFYASLYSPPLPTFEGIRDPALRRYARGKTAEGVADAYRAIYEAVTDERRGGYDDLSFLGHDPDQVKTLLSL